MAVPLYTDLFPESSLSRTAPHQGPMESGTAFRPSGKPGPARECDQADLFTYLLARGAEPEANPEECILSTISQNRTKDNLLSLRILDMTPGFGNVSTRLVETIAYLSFLLPYKEKHSFIAEWENEGLLHKFVLSRVLYGVEKDPFPLDVLQNSMLSRFDAPGVNYRLGDPLLGMSLGELFGSPVDKGRTGLFSIDSGDLTSRLKEMHRLHSTLSDRIKEDAPVKSEIAATLAVYRRRIGEIMDVMTAACFVRTLEVKKIGELLYYVDGDEEIWQAARATDWYVSAREMARKKHFFHMEIEFPFLLNDGFDLVFIQSALNYLWDDLLPAGEITKAYIKRAMAYLKQTGMIVLMGADLGEIVPDLRKSRRYAVEAKGGFVMVRRR